MGKSGSGWVKLSLLAKESGVPSSLLNLDPYTSYLNALARLSLDNICELKRIKLHQPVRITFAFTQETKHFMDKMNIEDLYRLLFSQSKPFQFQPMF